jgi:hypothetical protein
LFIAYRLRVFDDCTTLANLTGNCFGNHGQPGNDVKMSFHEPAVLILVLKDHFEVLVLVLVLVLDKKIYVYVLFTSSRTAVIVAIVQSSVDRGLIDFMKTPDVSGLEVTGVQRLKYMYEFAPSQQCAVQPCVKQPLLQRTSRIFVNRRLVLHTFHTPSRQGMCERWPSEY